MIRLLTTARALLLALTLSSCGTPLPKPAERSPNQANTPSAAQKPVATASKSSASGLKKGGGFYKDDGPGDFVPADIEAIPDAVPRAEALHRFANKPYSALGRDYVPMKKISSYKERGIGSWYGKKYHGQKTSSGERYDMYGMTAAHPTLPIPSYVRVSRPGKGKSVVVRVNDRGPFHAGRLIDLSWTAAYKLGYLEEGSTVVDVELIVPGQSLTPLNKMEARLDKAPSSHDGASDPIIQFAQALPETRDASGHYIQLGAFGNLDNAESLRTHLARELGVLSEKLVIQAEGKVFRVQLGPWPDGGSARSAGDQLRETLGMAPVFVQR